MSLILEALRKSEAERQRGRAPGLFVEQEVLRRPRRHLPAWVSWASAAALLLVLAAWGWREFGRGPAPSAAATAATTEAAIPNTTNTTAPAPAPTPNVAPSAASNTGPTIDQTSVEPPPATTQPLESAPTRLADPVATVDTTIAAPPAAAPAATPVPAPAPAAPTTAVDAATPASTPTMPTVAEEGPLPRLADLSPAERTALPPLKLSMHVYSDEPERRFVIVDGQRLTEGAAPAPGVVLEQIRRDGAVLSINGRRVLVSRP